MFAKLPQVAFAALAIVGGAGALGLAGGAFGLAGDAPGLAADASTGGAPARLLAAVSMPALPDAPAVVASPDGSGSPTIGVPVSQVTLPAPTGHQAGQGGGPVTAEVPEPSTLPLLLLAIPLVLLARRTA